MKVLLKSSFQDLLSKDNLFIIHHQNMQSLAAKIYKILNNLLGGAIDGLFTLYLFSPLRTRISYSKSKHCINREKFT